MDSVYRRGDPALRRINACLFAGGLATFAMIYSTQPLLPVLSADFGIPPGEAALSVSTTTLALGVVLVFVGPISDRFGRNFVINVSLALSALLCLGTAFVDNWTHLLWLRAALGVAVAGLPAVATAYIREEVDDRWATVTTALYIGGTAIGGMLGRFLTGTLAGHFGWRPAVAGVGSLGLTCAVVVAVWLPKSQHFQSAPLRPSALTRRTRAVLSDPVLVLLYIIGFCTMGTFVSVYNVLGYRLEAAPYHLPLELAGLIYLTYVFGSLASYLSGRAVLRWQVRPVLLVGCVISLAGLAISVAEPLWVLVFGICLVTIGFFIVHATASSWVVGRAAARGRAVAQAGSLYLFFYYLGSSLCGTLAAALWADGDWLSVLIFTGGLTATAGLIAVTLNTRPGLQSIKP